ncbi:unnamed protein product [Eruca vesicaria subsp. sativa]|uniref:Nudix hydrolase domain-containing protein n=1 Tax=Eruca vesicaria subsp. sativa TaxID=29727 RepID=A0ABC8KXI2_ERUVS|nr:unnamed protein product [Eruca vesicaria subsp. sativa]
MGVEKMVCLVSRTGRQFQRYNKGRRQVVGCIPYRFKLTSDGKISDKVEVLVISSQKGHAMMFPKGGWELDESVEEAASRESLEEAGVLGNVEHQLGKWDFLSKSRGTYYEGLMFPMLVTEQLELWPEQHARQRIWMNVVDAREACRDWWMKEALDVLVGRLSSPMNQPKEEKTLSISIETMC